LVICVLLLAFVLVVALLCQPEDELVTLVLVVAVLFKDCLADDPSS
jgi:hypothetical protein